jgi:hypothetical protein
VKGDRKVKAVRKMKAVRKVKKIMGEMRIRHGGVRGERQFPPRQFPPRQFPPFITMTE